MLPLGKKLRRKADMKTKKEIIKRLKELKLKGATRTLEESQEYCRLLLEKISLRNTAKLSV
jgi:hypothetical protein